MPPRRQRTYHNGGEQLPLLTPPSSWVPPTELPDLRRVGRLAEDLETRDDSLSAKRGPGWVYSAGHICGVAMAWAGGSIYVPVRHPDTQNFDEDAVRRWLTDHHTCPDLEIVFQNGPYDLGWSATQWGIPLPRRIHDTTAAAAMVDENRLSYKLDDIARWRGLPGKDEAGLREACTAYGYPPAEVKRHLWRLPARYVGPYAEQDAVATLGVFDSLAPEMREQGLEAAYELECDLIPLILEMRRRGIRVDTAAAERARDQLLGLRDQALDELSGHLSHTIGMDDIRSARQLQVYFDSERVPYPKTPKTDVGSFDKSWMRGHAHWLPRLVDLARQYDDAGGKFLTDYILSFTHRGRLHANVNQFRSEDGGTRSHRFSYSAPPLQQMPKRNDLTAALIRGVFLAEPGEIWCSCDYSQQEYKLIVHFSELRGLRRASMAGDRYRADPDTDYHQMVADLTGLERKPAKDANFAKAFGAGVDKFALMTNKTVAEAKAIMEQYDREMPFVSELAQECQRLASARGYIRLLDGARCHFDDWEPAYRNYQQEKEWTLRTKVGIGPCSLEEAKRRLSDPDHPWAGRLRRADTRKAGNRLIQGSAARQTKLAMRECWREGLVPLIQMHDELGHSCATEAQGQRVAQIMREVVQLRVPMSVDPEFGVNWGRAKKVKGGYQATWAEAVAELAGAGRTD